MNCQRKGGGEKKKGEKSQGVVFVLRSGSPEGLERHRDALRVRVLVLVVAGMRWDPGGKGLGAERGDTSSPKTAAGHFLRGEAAPSMELTPALLLILGGGQKSEKGKSR